MARVLTDETSLTLKRKRITRETQVLRTMIKVEAGAAILLLAAGVIVFAWNGNTSVIWLGVVAGVLFIAHKIKVRENHLEERRVEAGQKGEADVITLLNDALDNTHYILNDFVVKLSGKSAQIDHLVVCPKGIFVIETKNWRGHIEGDENDEFWRQKKDRDQPDVRVSNPIIQNRRHIEVLSGYLKRAGINWPDVGGIIVFRSARTTHYITQSSMPVLYPREAAEYIAQFKAPRIYRDDEITPVLNLLMKCA